MKEEINASPFSALSYQEQQDRWLEWRSRQLDFRKGPVEMDAKKEPTSTKMPPVVLPHAQPAAPTRHQNLDQVLSRHSQAVRKAGPFQTTR